MKPPCSFLRILLLLAFATGLAATARAYGDDIVAESPDHPKTWVDGATRTHQELRWSSEKHMLVADVTYSTADFSEGPHPTQEDNFVLSFPTVHFHPETGQFTAHGVVVAEGKPGSGVKPAPNITLSIHRHQGVIYGRLVANATESDSSTWH